jgi:hypothetical protein
MSWLQFILLILALGVGDFFLACIVGELNTIKWQFPPVRKRTPEEP